MIEQVTFGTGIAGRRACRRQCAAITKWARQQGHIGATCFAVTPERAFDNQWFHVVGESWSIRDNARTAWIEDAHGVEVYFPVRDITVTIDLQSTRRARVRGNVDRGDGVLVESDGCLEREEGSDDEGDL